MIDWIAKTFRWLTSLPDYIRYRNAQKKHRRQAKEQDKDMYPLW
jgi:hypothetical protein